MTSNYLVIIKAPFQIFDNVCTVELSLPHLFVLKGSVCRSSFAWADTFASHLFTDSHQIALNRHFASAAGSTPSLDSSVLRNLLLMGEDVNHGYSQGRMSGKSSKPVKSLIPALRNLTHLDCEVNAPVASQDGLLQGQRILKALDGQEQ